MKTQKFYRNLPKLYEPPVPYEPEKPLPPPEKWGTKENFKSHIVRRLGKKKKRSRRCQAFVKARLREGFTGAEAQCRNSAIRASNYCRIHSGGKEVPAATIDVEIDRYAQHLPADLKARYMAAKTDPELLSARNEVEVMTARISQVMERLATGESNTAWNQVIESEIVLREALQARDPNTLMSGLKAAHGMLRNAIKASDHRVWQELEALMHSRTRLAETESRRIIALQQFLTVEQLVTVAADLQRAMYEVITDVQQRREVARIFKATFFEDADMPEEGLEDDRYRWGHAEGQRGCYICTVQAYRIRNRQTDDWFKCNYCKTVWEPQYQNAPAGDVIDVVPLLIAPDSDANVQPDEVSPVTSGRPGEPPMRVENRPPRRKTRKMRPRKRVPKNQQTPGRKNE